MDNPERIKLMKGPFDTEAMSIWVEAWYCRGHDHCKLEEELQDFFKKDLYFSFFSNSRKYQPNSYGDEILLEHA